MRKEDIICDIEKIINKGDLINSKLLADEYIKNFDFDSSIASVKAVISFYEGNDDECLKIIKHGLMCNLWAVSYFST